MKPLLILISILLGFLSIQAQYDYPYDSGNHYYDNTPRLIIQKSRIMGWYVSDINGNRISDYYEQIRPHRQGRAAALDKIMGWCFISLDGKRCTDYYLLVDDFHEGYALVKDKIMGYCFINRDGHRLGDYYEEAYPFHRGVALVKDKIMGWYLLNNAGKRISDYHDLPRDFQPTRPPHRPW